MKDIESVVEQLGIELARRMRETETAWVRQHPRMRPHLLRQALMAGAMLAFVDTIARCVETHPQREKLIQTILAQLPKGIQVSLDDLAQEETPHA